MAKKEKKSTKQKIADSTAKVVSVNIKQDPKYTDQFIDPKTNTDVTTT